MQQGFTEDVNERLGAIRLPVVAVGLEIGLCAAKKIFLRGKLDELHWQSPVRKIGLLPAASLPKLS